MLSTGRSIGGGDGVEFRAQIQQNFAYNPNKPFKPVFTPNLRPPQSAFFVGK